MTDSGLDLQALKSRAQDACTAAYAPYSRFRVGATVVGEGGQIFSGCNVENASYGLTMCAERNAIAAAVAAGVKSIQTVLVYTPGQQAHAPCGGCRQVMQELMGPMANVISCCDSEDVKEWTVAEILPHPFWTTANLGP
jgi:cytidine deaminase